MQLNYEVNCRLYITIEVQKNTQLIKINHNQVDKWNIDPYIVLDVQIRSQFPKTLDQSQIIILDYKPFLKIQSSNGDPIGVVKS